MLSSKPRCSFNLSVLTLAVWLLSLNVRGDSLSHLSGQNIHGIQAQRYTLADYQRDDATKMFPAPDKGMAQHILTLPALANEQRYMLQIQIGQPKMVDCNKHGLRGKLRTETVDGWGYDYYRLDSVAEGPSTMMACFDKALSEAFLLIPAELKLPYDSRLPKVFYLPEKVQLRYRLWSVDSDFRYSK